MSKRAIINTTIAVATCLLLFGCYPKTINWSPNGQWAAYCNGVGLFFINGEGKISEKMCEHVPLAEWFPDGKRLAIEQFAKLTSWQQVENTISREYQEKYVQYAEGLLSVKDIQDWDEKTKKIMDHNLLDKGDLKAVQLYIRDVASSGFPKEVIESWGSYIEFRYHFLRIGTWDGKNFSIGEPLWASPERIWDMRVSAKGRVVAFTSAFPGVFDAGAVSSLWVVDIETQKVELLDRNISLYPDWDASGTTLFYVRSMGKESSDSPLGTMLKRRLCDKDGRLLSDFPEVESLAGLVAGEYTKIRCLSDGRIIFSSMEVTLPVIGKDVPELKQLFVLDPQRQSTIARLIPRSTQNQTYGYNFDCFEISPDETQISIPDNDGRVATLRIATGDFTVLQAQGTGGIKTVPVWRYPNELCYIDEIKGGLAGDKKRKQMMLRKVASDGTWSQPRVISESWPEEARKVVLP